MRLADAQAEAKKLHKALTDERAAAAGNDRLTRQSMRSTPTCSYAPASSTPAIRTTHGRCPRRRRRACASSAKRSTSSRLRPMVPTRRRRPTRAPATPRRCRWWSARLRIGRYSRRRGFAALNAQLKARQDPQTDAIARCERRIVQSAFPASSSREVNPATFSSSIKDRVPASPG